MKRFTILAAAVLASAVLLPATSQAGVRYGGVFKQGVSLNGTDGATLEGAAPSSEQQIQAVTLPDGSLVETGTATDERE